MEFKQIQKSNLGSNPHERSKSQTGSACVSGPVPLTASAAAALAASAFADRFGVGACCAKPKPTRGPPIARFCAAVPSSARRLQPAARVLVARHLGLGEEELAGAEYAARARDALHRDHIRSLAQARCLTTHGDQTLPWLADRAKRHTAGTTASLEVLELFSDQSRRCHHRKWLKAH